MEIIFIVLAFIVVLVVLSLLSSPASDTTESFIVDWGLTASPYRCRGGGMTDDEMVPPTHTAVCDIWSDPEHIIDERVERALDSTYTAVREIEDFLHVNVPNKRERVK